MIEVKNLVKKYGDHTAVDHLSLQLKKDKSMDFSDRTAPENLPQ